MNIILRTTLNCERDTIVGWNMPWGLDFHDMSTASSAQEASRSQAHQSLAQPTRSLRERGRRLFKFEVRHG